MTQKEMYLAIANLEEVKANAEMVDFINHKIEQLDNRKASGKTSLTKTQKENLELKEVIMDALSGFDRATVTELLGTPEIQGYAEAHNVTISSQKVSALLRLLIQDKRVDKVIEKKVAYFSIRKEEE